MKICTVLLVAAVVAGVASAGFFAHPLPLLRTPRIYNIIVRSDGSLLPSAAYSLPLDHPIFHTPAAAAPSAAKAAPSAASAKDADSDKPAAASPAESESSAPAAPAPPPHLPIVPPPLPITHVAVNFPGSANSSSEHTVVATTLPFYSLYHPLAFPIPDPTPFIHPFGPHPGYFFASAFHPPAPALAAEKASPKSAKKEEGEEKAKDEKGEAERRRRR